jgi:hypothetical protein
MSGDHDVLRRFKLLWDVAWPLWTLGMFAGLAAVHLLPGGLVRAAIAAPILLMVPGSLTLGAIFSRRHRPRGLPFVSFASLASAAWLIFTSLVLYSRGILITATSTYWCLLAVSAALAIAAGTRRVLEHQGKGRRVAGVRQLMDLDLSDAEANDTEMQVQARGGGFYAVLAVVAGASLLAGGTYAYDHLPHPPPPGYTWIDWTRTPDSGDIAIGAVGANLNFQIVHRQSDTTIFKLTAVWSGTPSRPLARPVTVSIGPNQMYHGDLFVPPLPDGCTYRIILALTAPGQIDPLTRKPQVWTINADVHDPGKPSKTCR